MKSAPKRNTFLIIGLLLLIFGSGPLLITMLLAGFGGGDPNPNPVIFGMMAGFTFWPAIFLIGLGLYKKYRKSSPR